MQALLQPISRNGDEARSPGSPAPRILIFSVSAGSGHLRAAEALEAAVRQLVPHARVRNVDVLSLATKPFRY
jgi:hypothetical protein